MCSGPTVATPTTGASSTTRTSLGTPGTSAVQEPGPRGSRKGAGLIGKRADMDLLDQRNADSAFTGEMVAPGAPVQPNTEPPVPGASAAPGFGLSRTAGRGIFSIGDLRRTSVSSLKPGDYPKIRG